MDSTSYLPVLFLLVKAYAVIAQNLFSLEFTTLEHPAQNACRSFCSSRLVEVSNTSPGCHAWNKVDRCNWRLLEPSWNPCIIPSLFQALKIPKSKDLMSHHYRPGNQSLHFTPLETIWYSCTNSYKLIPWFQEHLSWIPLFQITFHEFTFKKNCWKVSTQCLVNNPFSKAFNSCRTAVSLDSPWHLVV